MLISILNESREITDSDLTSLLPALNYNAGHCAAAWGLEAPAITTDVAVVAAEPQDGVVMLIDSTPPPGSAAVHYWEPLKQQPYARVYVPASTGLTEGHKSLSELISHEICELCVNSQLNLWYPMPRRRGVECAVEVCDMVQDTYDVRGVPVANFVEPGWFFEGFRGPCDHAKRLRRTGEIGPKGYAILKDSREIWLETARGGKPLFDGQLSASKQHPLCRTKRLLEATTCQV